MMINKWLVFGILCLNFTETVFSASFNSSDLHAADRHAVPLVFEKNLGQAPASVQYLAHAKRYDLWLSSNGMQLNLRAPESDRPLHINFVGDGNPLEGVTPLPGKSHYLIDTYTGLPVVNVPHFERVHQKVTEKLDAEYYNRNGQVEFDLLVHPGKNPADIQLNVEGADALYVSNDGALQIEVNGRVVWQDKPYAYQVIGDQQIEVEVAYVVSGNAVRFDVGEYDDSSLLIIDPVLQYASFMGGNSLDVGNAVALDSADNVYLVGETRSTDMPGLNAGGGWRGFLYKLTPDAKTIIYATLLGDSARDVAVNEFGEAHVLTRNGAIKLSSDGSRALYQKSLLTDAAHLALDAVGQIYIAGTLATNSSLIIDNYYVNDGDGRGAYDAAVVKIDPLGGVAFVTAIGGEKDDRAQGIALDRAGNVVFGGGTQSTKFPIAGNAFQRTRKGGVNEGFVAKLNNSGSLIFSTFIGGSGLSDDGSVSASSDDGVISVAVDSAGNPVVVGVTGSADFHLVNPFVSQKRRTSNGRDLPDGYVSKLRSDGGALLFSSYLGGASATDVVIDSLDNMVVIGEASNVGFQLVNSEGSTTALQRTSAALYRFASDGTANFATIFGGLSEDKPLGLAVNAANDIFIAGKTESYNFPVVSSIQEEPGNLPDAFIVKFGQNLTTDIRLDAIANLGQVFVGDTFNVTWSVSHALASQAEAEEVTLAIALPEGVSFVGAGTASCVPVGQNLFCTLPSLAVNDQWVIGLSLLAGESGEFSIDAGVSSKSTDTDPNNNFALATILIEPLANLDMNISHNVETAKINEPITTVVTLSNSDRATAYDVRANGNLDEGATLLSINASGASCSFDAAAWQCAFGLMGANAAHAIKMVWRSDMPGNIGGLAQHSIRNEANASDNSLSYMLSVIGEANLKLESPVGVIELRRGEQSSWLASVSNLGPHIAKNVMLQVHAPAFLNLDSAELGGKPCAVLAGNIDCLVESLANGAQAELRIVFSSVDVGAGDMTSIVSASEIDGDMANNEGVVNVVVIDEVDLVLMQPMIDMPLPYLQGERLVMRFDVENRGPAIARNTLLRVEGAQLDQLHCPEEPAENGCLLGDLMPGNYTFFVELELGAGGDRSLAWQLASDTAEIDESNQIAMQQFDVQATTNLSVDLLGLPSSVEKLRAFSHQLQVRNVGLADANNVEVVYVLPKYLKMIAFDQRDVCRYRHHELVCRWTQMKVGSMHMVNLKMRAVRSSAEDLVLAASVKSSVVELRSDLVNNQVERHVSVAKRHHQNCGIFSRSCHPNKLYVKACVKKLVSIVRHHLSKR